MRKKLVLLLLTITMAATTLLGCAKTSESTTVAEVGNHKITADIANFYLRYNQAQYETYYKSLLGDNMWDTEVSEGTTYADTVKEQVLSNLELMYVLEDHMKDYKVELTKENEKEIEEATKAFLKENDEKTNQNISASESSVKEILKLLTIQSKMREAIIADADTKVSDEEANQKSMDYVMFSYTSTDDQGKQTKLSDEEVAALKEKAKAFREGALSAEDFKAYATEQGVEPQQATFDKEATTPNEALVKAADALGEGEVTEVVETDTGSFVAKVTSLHDEEATNKKKEEIVSERQSALYKEVTEAWKKDTKIKVNKKAWNKINIKDLNVTIYQKQSEETESKQETDN